VLKLLQKEGEVINLLILPKFDGVYDGEIRVREAREAVPYLVGAR